MLVVEEEEEEVEVVEEVVVATAVTWISLSVRDDRTDTATGPDRREGGMGGWVERWDGRLG